MTITVNDMIPGRSPHWEGNVVTAVALGLRQSGYQIEKIANTARREPGPDIIATSPAGRTLWVSAKGWPEKSEYAQARHWFASAILDMIIWRDPSRDLAIALPAGFQTYEALVQKSAWLQAVIPFKVLWSTRVPWVVRRGQSHPIDLLKRGQSRSGVAP